MANVTLRFHGRFLYAEQTSTKKLFVVAPTFDPNGDFGAHQPLMSIRHDQVIFKAKDHQTVITTFEPSFRILSEVNAKDPQVLVWDLSGCTVTYETNAVNDGRLTPAGSVVASLKELEANENRTAVLDTAALDPNVNKPFANTLIEVTSQGLTKSAHSIDYFFSHEDKAKNGQPEAVKVKGTQNPFKKKPSEIVEFAVPVPPAPTGEAPRLVLKLKRKNGESGEVCVEAGGVVCFAHNCPRIQELPTTDLEFMRYYDALRDHDLKALIPFEDESGLIEGIPCYQQSQMSF